MMNITRSINFVAQWLAVRLYTRGSLRADRQRGASALEYIVLAGVLVAIILIVAQAGLGAKLAGIFQTLFEKASDTGTS